MARYILLLNWTDQGIKNVKDSPGGLDAGRALAKKMGCEIREFYMTTGVATWWRSWKPPTTPRRQNST